MFVKLLVSRSGDGFSQSVGDVVEVGDAEGGRMLAAGQCERVVGSGSPPPVEAAAEHVGPPEVPGTSAEAAAPSGRGKREKR